MQPSQKQVSHLALHGLFRHLNVEESGYFLFLRTALKLCLNCVTKKDFNEFFRVLLFFLKKAFLNFSSSKKPFSCFSAMHVHITEEMLVLQRLLRSCSVVERGTWVGSLGPQQLDCLDLISCCYLLLSFLGFNSGDFPKMET